MCGIGGLVRDRRPCDLATLAALAAALRHRGPDATGLLSSGACGVVATRLAICGPPGLPAPLADPASGAALAYNGALYGPPQRHRHGDSGWLLERLAGDPGRGTAGGVADLDGMFAFALLRPTGGEVTLARDRLGVKPLYLARDGHDTLFASEVGALARVVRPRTRLRASLVFEALALGTLLGPETLLGGIEELPPGSWRTMRAARPGTGGEGTLTAVGAGGSVNGSGAVKEADLTERLRAAVLYAAEYGGSLGLLLSAGVDSVTIAHVLAGAGVEDVQTFSLLLDGDGIPDLGALGLPGRAWQSWTHHTRTVDDATFCRAYDAVLATTSQPVFPASTAYVWLLAEMAADKGVRVVLSGEGVDELFGGYRSYLAARESSPVDFYATQEAFSLTTRLLRGGRAAAGEVRERLGALVRYPAGLRGLLQPELHISLRPLLARLDHAAMRHGVEARVPFLHHGIPEAAAGRDDWSPAGPAGLTKPVFRRAVAPLWGRGMPTTAKRPLRAPLGRVLTAPRRAALAARTADPGTADRLGLDPAEATRLARGLTSRPTDAELLVALRVDQVHSYLDRHGTA